MYSDILTDHLQNPRNVGKMDDPDGVSTVENPACGDVMQLFLKVEEGRIIDAKFKTFGCGPSVAASSIVTELIKGKKIEEALKISKETVNEALGGLPQAKMHSAILAEDALKAAIRDYLQKNGTPSL